MFSDNLMDAIYIFAGRLCIEHTKHHIGTSSSSGEGCILFQWDQRRVPHSTMCMRNSLFPLTTPGLSIYCTCRMILMAGPLPLTEERIYDTIRHYKERSMPPRLPRGVCGHDWIPAFLMLVCMGQSCFTSLRFTRCWVVIKCKQFNLKNHLKAEKWASSFWELFYNQ